MEHTHSLGINLVPGNCILTTNNGRPSFANYAGDCTFWNLHCCKQSISNNVLEMGHWAGEQAIDPGRHPNVYGPARDGLLGYGRTGRLAVQGCVALGQLVGIGHATGLIEDGIEHLATLGAGLPCLGEDAQGAGNVCLPATGSFEHNPLKGHGLLEFSGQLGRKGSRLLCCFNLLTQIKGPLARVHQGQHHLVGKCRVCLGLFHRVNNLGQESLVIALLCRFGCNVLV